MKRYFIIYSGIVQGVGFRWRIMNIANRYGLTGIVRNLSNGDVEVQVQGNEDGLNAFLKDSLSKDRFIMITDYSVKEMNTVENEKEFRVVF